MTTVGTTPRYVGKTIALTLGATGASTMSVYLQGGTAAYVPYATSATFNYAGSDGPITLCVTFKDAAGHTSDQVCDSATADVTPPTVPAGVVLTGGGRGASMSWTASTDTASGVAGYRVYYGTSTAYGGTGAVEGNSPYQVTPTSATLTGVTFGGVTFHVSISAVDAVGNESLLAADQTFITGTPYYWVFPTWGPLNAKALQCIDANTCYVLTGVDDQGSGVGSNTPQYPGNRSGLNKTINGGGAWTLLDMGSAAVPLTMRWRDANVGLVSLTEGGKLRRTEDGGKTWTVVTLPLAPSSLYGTNIYDIHWFNPSGRPNDVLVLGRIDPGARYRFLSSSDAGKTFTDLGDTTGVVDSNYWGWFAVQDATPSAEKLVMGWPGNYVSHLYNNHTAGSFVAFDQSISNFHTWAAAFRASNNGITVGSVGGTKAVYYENTGTLGAWTQGSLANCGAAGGAPTLYHLNYPNTMAYASGGGFLCKSGDGGATWTNVDHGYEKGTTNFYYNNVIDAMDFVDDTHGFLQITDASTPTLLKTANASTNPPTWSLMQPNLFRSVPAASPRIRLMSWVDENTGWVGDSPNGNFVSSYWRTTDGGATWTQMTLCDSAVNALKFFSANFGVAFNGAKFCYSGNGGGAWTQSTGASSANLYGTASQWNMVGVDSPDATNVFLVGSAGSNGAVATSTNAGGAFTQLTSVTGEALVSAARTVIPGGTPTTVLYVGTQSSLKLYRSIWSGTAWGGWSPMSAVNNVPGWGGGSCCANIDKIIFPTRGGTGYLFSLSKGDVLKTIDGGATWGKVNVDAGGQAFTYPYSLTDLECENDSKCSFIAGGEIWVTTDGFATARRLTVNASGFMANPLRINVLGAGLQFSSGNLGQLMKTKTYWQ
jgi:hypothetical protein